MSMSARPQVSVIIPTYKRPKECLRAVKSVLLQTFKDFEVIVGDDYGKDETGKLLAELDDSRIHYFDNQGKGGSASKNRNLCVGRSAGLYVTFLDSDDFILPDKLQLQYDALRDVNDEVGFVISGTRVVKVHDGKYYRYKDLIPTAEGDIREAYFGRRLSCYNTSLMVRSDALDAVGLWDPAVGPYDDSELIMRLLLRYQAVRVNDISTLWFDHDGDDSFSNDQVARRHGLEVFISKHTDLVANYPVWATYRIKELAKALFIAGKAEDCRRWLKRLPSRPSVSLRLMMWGSYVPGCARSLKVLYPIFFKYNKPSWLKVESVPLESLIPGRYLDAMRSILSH